MREGEEDKEHGGGSGFSFWGLGSMLADNASNLVSTVVETDWQRELAHIQEELTEDVRIVERSLGLSHTGAEAEAEAGPAADAPGAAASAFSFSHFGQSLLTGTKEIFEQVASSIDSAVAPPKAASRSRTSAGRPEPKPRMSRQEMQISSMQRSSSTYCDEPEDTEAFAAFCADFQMEDRQADIDALLESNAFMAELHMRLVPDVISRTDFWQRYFFRLEQLLARPSLTPGTASAAASPSPVPPPPADAEGSGDVAAGMPAQPVGGEDSGWLPQAVDAEDSSTTFASPVPPALAPDADSMATGAARSDAAAQGSAPAAAAVHTECDTGSALPVDASTDAVTVAAGGQPDAPGVVLHEEPGRGGPSGAAGRGGQQQQGAEGGSDTAARAEADGDGLPGAEGPSGPADPLAVPAGAAGVGEDAGVDEEGAGVEDGAQAGVAADAQSASQYSSAGDRGASEWSFVSEPVVRAGAGDVALELSNHLPDGSGSAEAATDPGVVTPVAAAAPAAGTAALVSENGAEGAAQQPEPEG